MYSRILHVYGPVWINGYGLMIALGALVFTYLTYSHEWRKRLLSPEAYTNVLFIGFLSAVFGGRILFLLFNFSSFDSVKEIFYPWVGGFSLFGSILSVLISVSIYLRIKKVPIFQFFDFISVYIPILQAISRIGCFMAGCCYGAKISASAWWGVTFTSANSIAPTGIPLHPTQLYSSAASLLIFLILFYMSKKLYKIPGLILLSYLCMESLSRFVIDFWRGDRDQNMQIIVGSIFVLSLIFILFVKFCLHKRLSSSGTGNVDF
jgi:phosphatidylglycerol:prolipoprotein diacylglycerol transferase